MYKKKRPDSTTAHGLPAMALVRTPRYMTLSAAVLMKFLVLLTVGLVLLPWQQTARGNGRVIAYTPAERAQRVDAPKSGQIDSWSVVEGARVKRGDVLVTLRDNDSELPARIEREINLTKRQIQATKDSIKALGSRLEALEKMRGVTIKSADAKVRVAENSLKAARQKLRSAQAKHKAARQNRTRQNALNREGLVSNRKRELTEMKEATARADVFAAKANIAEYQAKLFQSRADRIKAESEADAKIAKARSDRQLKRADLQKYEAKVLQLQTKRAHLKAMVVRAPRDGVVLQVNDAQQGAYVKAGQALATIVPDTANRAVEIWVDGNDAPLVTPGRHVRLQFEGWPAVQFSGWPSVAIGTFAGEVAFVDAASAKAGKFRVLIRPPEGVEWPEPLYLRQGARVNAWVLLDEVRLGYELWRQLNGFPPAMDSPPKTQAMGGKKKGGK